MKLFGYSNRKYMNKKNNNDNMIFNIHKFSLSSLCLFYFVFIWPTIFFPFNYIDKVINLWIKMLDLFRVCLKKNTENT